MSPPFAPIELTPRPAATASATAGRARGPASAPSTSAGERRSVETWLLIP